MDDQARDDCGTEPRVAAVVFRVSLCRSCGTGLPQNAAYCPGCGRSTQPPPPAEALAGLMLATAGLMLLLSAACKRAGRA